MSYVAQTHYVAEDDLESGPSASTFHVHGSQAFATISGTIQFLKESEADPCLSTSVFYLLAPSFFPEERIFVHSHLRRIELEYLKRIRQRKCLGCLGLRSTPGILFETNYDFLTY